MLPLSGVGKEAGPSARVKRCEAGPGAGTWFLLLRLNCEGAAQDPSKPCVKNHHSLVLRAASASEKYMWLARLRNAGDAAAKREPRSYASSDLQRSAESTTSSVAPTPRIRSGGVSHLTT